MSSTDARPDDAHPRTARPGRVLLALALSLFDDGQGIDLPSTWKLRYWTGSAYADVPGASGYPVAANGYNTVTHATISTTRLRVVLQSNGTASVGLLEVRAFTPASTPAS